MNTSFKILCIFFLMTISSSYGQRGEVYSNIVSLSRNGESNGFDYQGVKFKYQFVNCGGEVQLMVDYEKNAVFTKFWYNKKSYSKEQIGQELWPSSNNFSIGEVTADLYFGSQNLGKISLKYIVGNFAGCFGETYGVVKSVGKDPTLNEYKTKINTFSLKNLKVIGGGDSNTSRYYKIVAKINKSENEVRQKKKEEELQVRVNTILKSANHKLQIYDYTGAKVEFQKAYAIKKDPSILKSIEDINKIITEKANKERLDKEKIELERVTQEKLEQERQDKRNAAENNSSSVTNTTITSNSSKSNSKSETSISTEKKHNSTTDKKPNTIGNTGKTYEQLEYERRAYERQQKEKLQMVTNPGGYAMQKSGANAFFSAEINRINREADAKRAREEKEWAAEEARERRREREQRRRDAEYRKQQEIERLKAEENKKIADAKLKEDYNSWSRTTAHLFKSKLSSWNASINNYINGDLGKYGFFIGEKLPHWMDFLSMAIDKIVVSNQFSPQEKKTEINKIFNFAKQYRDICRNYNFQAKLESNNDKLVSKIFKYTKTNNGYDPLSNSFNYGIYGLFEPKVENPIAYNETSYTGNFRQLYGSYNANNDGYGKKLTSKDYSINLNYRYYIPRDKKYKYDKTTRPYLYAPLKQEHLGFLEAYERKHLNQLNIYSKESEEHLKPFKIRAKHFYSKKKNQAEMLFEFYTLLAYKNIKNVNEFIGIETKNRLESLSAWFTNSSFYESEVKLENASNTQRTKIYENKTKQLELTFSIAHALLLNGYLHESEELFKQIKDVLILNRNKLSSYDSFYFEALSFYIAVLYQQGKYSEAIKNETLLRSLAAMMDNSKTKGKPTKLNSLYMDPLGSNSNAEIHADYYTYSVYARGLAYIAASFNELGNKKSALKIFGEFKKELKEFPKFDNYYSVAPFIAQLFKELDPKTYQKSIANIDLSKNQLPIASHISLAQQKANPSIWEEKYKTQIDSINYYFNSKKYDRAMVLGKKLLPTLHFEAAKSNNTFQETMQVCAEASLYEERYAYGVTFANYSLSENKQAKSMILLLLNAIMLNFGDIQLADIKVEGIDGYKNPYHLVELLEIYKKEDIGGLNGQTYLINIEREMANQRINNEYLPFMYHVISSF